MNAKAILVIAMPAVMTLKDLLDANVMLVILEMVLIAPVRE